MLWMNGGCFWSLFNSALNDFKVSIISDYLRGKSITPAATTILGHDDIGI